MSTSAAVSIGVGFDTAHYGHHVSFLRTDRQPAAKAFTFAESPAGYAELRQAFERLQQKYGEVHFSIRIDAAGQYAANLERFLRSLPWEKTISVGQPKQNRDYRNVHFPKRKADAVDVPACAASRSWNSRLPRPRRRPISPSSANSPARWRARSSRPRAWSTSSTIAWPASFPSWRWTLPTCRRAWVLRLLEKYPSPAKIAGAHLSSLVSIPHLSEDKAQKIQAAARQTVASLQGPVVEGLIRQSVQTIRTAKKPPAS